jgi:hypothetical protein
LEIAELLTGPVKNHPAHRTLVLGIVAVIAKTRKDAVKSALEAAVASAT